MKNITLSIDEYTHRQARIRAAELGTSVSALVRICLNRLISEPPEEPVVNGQESETRLERRRRELKELFEDWDARGIGLKMSENIPRDELYDHNAFR